MVVWRGSTKWVVQCGELWERKENGEGGRGSVSRGSFNVFKDGMVSSKRYAPCCYEGEGFMRIIGGER